MKLLYLTHRCPYPPNKGERIRCFHILKHLAQRYDTTLIYPAFTDEERRHATLLHAYASAVMAVPLHPLRATLQGLGGLLSQQSLTTRYFFSAKIHAAVRQQACDIFLIDCSSMAPYALDVSQPRIIDFVDVDSDKWRLYAQQAGWLPRLVYQREFRHLQAFEAHINQTFEACLVVSEEEKRLLPYPANVTVMPNGIDCQAFVPRGPQPEGTLIFTGAMNYFPNVDGVTWFHREIWPHVKAHHPAVRWLIAGMDPAPQVRALEAADITVTGYVPDMRDMLAQATVCVVPLRIAKGVQNKVLEAMAMGIPVVATPAANTGIHARDQDQVLLAEHPADFAHAIRRLLHDPALRATLAANARRFVEEHYSWATHLQTLDTLITQVTKTA